MLVSALVLSVSISYQLSNVFLVALPLLVVLVGSLLIKVGPMFRSLQEKTDALNLVVQENLTGIRVVKSFVREDHEREKFARRNLDLKRTSERAFGMVVINMPIMMLIIYGTIIAVMWFGGQMVFAGTLDTGKLMTYFTYITQIMVSLMMVSMVFMMLTRSVACARRIAEVLEERPSIDNEKAQEGAGFRMGPSSSGMFPSSMILRVRSGFCGMWICRFPPAPQWAFWAEPAAARVRWCR